MTTYEEWVEEGRRADEERKSDDAAEANRRKAEVGMAEPGTDEYNRNAAYILRAYTQPNAETQGKLDSLRRHGY